MFQRLHVQVCVKESDNSLSLEVCADASCGILSVTARVIKSKSTSLYLLCRTVNHRAAEAPAAAPSIFVGFHSLRYFNNTVSDLSPCLFFHSFWSTDDNETLCPPPYDGILRSLSITEMRRKRLFHSLISVSHSVSLGAIVCVCAHVCSHTLCRVFSWPAGLHMQVCVCVCV